MLSLHAHIINLKHRVDRHDYIVEEIKKLPSITSYTIVEGIIDDTKTCFQSQRKSIQLAKEKKLPYILVLEDDAFFTEEANTLLQKTFNEVQQLEWDMFFLGANLQTHATRVSDSLIKLNGAFCAHAYIVNKNFYDTILSLPHTCDMDTHYCNLMLHHNIFMCDPMIAFQSPSHSDLQNGYRDYNQILYEHYLIFKS